MTQKTNSTLAIHGGPAAFQDSDNELFHWPIVTAEDEAAVCAVMRAGSMSEIDLTIEFEKDICAWQGSAFALCTCNGTASLAAAMFGIGLGAGDEIIGPAMSYWATLLPAIQLRAVPVVADVDAYTMCIDPQSIAQRITDKSKAIIVNHQFGHPCDMDAIMALAHKHNLKVIEDVSHAQGGLYKGKKLGSIGDVGAMSMMGAKSLAAGEGGVLVTDHRQIWERASAFGHYLRTAPNRAIITDPDLQALAGLPLGGIKHRINQMSSAFGRVQLQYYDQRCAEIRKAMHYFLDCLDDLPGIQAHRTNEENSNMAGWYSPIMHYQPEELHDVPVEIFAKAVAAEGTLCNALQGWANALHRHPMFQDADVFHEGTPTVRAHSARTNMPGPGSCPVAEASNARVLLIPWFKHCDKSAIEAHANCYRKVIENISALSENSDA
ncbi:MAG: aminotransferase class V-fold PLP-dependent enzyme [Planctomycetes bacterium]|nr:aminotransferase class V-fold PLP-dependent enzyme [Planctomycetota bacterium]